MRHYSRYTCDQTHLRAQCVRVFGRLSGVEARTDGLTPVFAPEVFAELDLSVKTLRRLAVSADGLFGSRFKAGASKSFRHFDSFRCVVEFWSTLRKSRGSPGSWPDTLNLPPDAGEMPAPMAGTQRRHAVQTHPAPPFLTEIERHITRSVPG